MIADALADQVLASVVIAAPSGMGRSRLLAVAAGEAARGSRRVERVVATAAAASIPFGAVAHLLPERAFGVGSGAVARPWPDIAWLLRDAATQWRHGPGQAPPAATVTEERRAGAGSRAAAGGFADNCPSARSRCQRTPLISLANPRSRLLAAPHRHSSEDPVMRHPDEHRTSTRRHPSILVTRAARPVTELLARWFR